MPCFQNEGSNLSLVGYLFITLLLAKEGLASIKTDPSSNVVDIQYKMYIDSAREDCVFQLATSGSVFYVNFYVINGWDGLGKFSVKNPLGVAVLPAESERESTYHTKNAVDGYYKICIENGSTYFSKLIGIRITTYGQAGWDRFVDDLNLIDYNAQNFTRTFTAISEGIEQVLEHLHWSKSHAGRDFALLKENNYNVGFWSMIQCTIIILSGCTHVYTIRRFFRETASFGKYKVRA